MTDNCASASVCSPTRAAFLTGRYQLSVSMDLTATILASALVARRRSRPRAAAAAWQRDVDASPHEMTFRCH